MLLSASGSASSASSVPSGSASKAAFVGANTVNGPTPRSVSSKPVAMRASTKIEKSGLPAAMSTMVCDSGGGISTASMA